MEDIGDRIRILRKKLGLTQQELGKRCGWDSRARMSNYEMNLRHPRRGDLEKIANALGTTPAYLEYGRVDVPAQKQDNGLDTEVLSMLMAEVDRALQSLGRDDIDPAKKARLVAFLYRETLQGEDTSARRVRDFVSLLT